MTDLSGRSERAAGAARQSEDRAQRVDVRAGVDRRRLLGRHVALRPAARREGVAGDRHRSARRRGQTPGAPAPSRGRAPGRSSPIMMFAGFRSRWITPRACANATVSQMRSKRRSRSGSGSARGAAVEPFAAHEHHHGEHAAVRQAARRRGPGRCRDVRAGERARFGAQPFGVRRRRPCRHLDRDVALRARDRARGRRSPCRRGRSPRAVRSASPRTPGRSSIRAAGDRSAESQRRRRIRWKVSPGGMTSTPSRSRASARNSSSVAHTPRSVLEDDLAERAARPGELVRDVGHRSPVSRARAA